jgi:hypothetical protein
MEKGFEMRQKVWWFAHRFGVPDRVALDDNWKGQEARKAHAATATPHSRFREECGFGAGRHELM